jgi:hypothetical protein
VAGRSPHKAPRGISIPLGAFDFVEDYDLDFLSKNGFTRFFVPGSKMGGVRKLLRFSGSRPECSGRSFFFKKIEFPPRSKSLFSLEKPARGEMESSS